MRAYTLIFPDGFDESEGEITAKGWYAGVRLEHAHKHYCLNFYDPTRLGQDVASEHQRGSVFFEPNLIVIESISRSNIEKAVAQLIAMECQNTLTPL